MARIGRKVEYVEVVPVDKPMTVPDWATMPAAPAEPQPVKTPEKEPEKVDA